MNKLLSPLLFTLILLMALLVSNDTEAQVVLRQDATAQPLGKQSLHATGGERPRNRPHPRMWYSARFHLRSGFRRRW
jgi:hypothetical protein